MNQSTLPALTLVLISIYWVWTFTEELRYNRNIRKVCSSKNTFSFEIEYDNKIRKIEMEVKESSSKMHEITCFEIEDYKYNGSTKVIDIFINKCHVAKIIDSSFDYKTHILINHKYDINIKMLSKICKKYNKEYYKSIYSMAEIKKSVF